MTSLNISYKICKGHIKPIIDKCIECKHDYDTNHHPNNYDCRDRELVEIVDGTCIEHVRYSEDLETIKPECKKCNSDFLNHFCKQYYPYPPIKSEEVIKRFKEKGVNCKTIENRIVRCVNLMNIGILKSGKRVKIDYNEIINKISEYFLEENYVNLTHCKESQFPQNPQII